MTLVQSFKTGTYTVARRSSGTYVEGIYRPGEPCTLGISGSLQVASPRDTQVLPEGHRVKVVYKLYTDAQLKTVREHGQALADRITLYGESYVVMQSERWDGTDIPHFKALCVKEDVEQEAGEK